MNRPKLSNCTFKLKQAAGKPAETWICHSWCLCTCTCTISLCSRGFGEQLHFCCCRPFLSHPDVCQLNRQRVVILLCVLGFSDVFPWIVARSSDLKHGFSYWSSPLVFPVPLEITEMSCVVLGWLLYSIFYVVCSSSHYHTWFSVTKPTGVPYIFIIIHTAAINSLTMIDLLLMSTLLSVIK